MLMPRISKHKLGHMAEEQKSTVVSGQVGRRFSAPSPKKLYIVLLVGIFFALAGGIYLFRDQLRTNRSEQQRSEEALKAMEASQIKDTYDPAQTLAIDQKIYAGEFTQAQEIIRKFLSENPNLAERDRRTLYTQLSLTCIPLKDLTCIDDIVGEYGKLLPIDLFYLRDAAKLAIAEGASDKAKSYYAKGLEEINKEGGESYIDSLNENAQVQLSYAEFVQGAQ